MDPRDLFGPVATRTHRIDNFQTFILNNVPYGEVRPTNLQWGAVQYDGPAAAGIDGAKPALQWHFGGVPYAISKAIRIQYSYIRTVDGSNAPTTDQIFLGFQDRLTDFILPQPVPYVATPTDTFRVRVQNLGPFGGFSNPVWASDSGVLASEAAGVVTRSFNPNNPDTFNALIQEELNWIQASFDALVSTSRPIDFDGPAQDSDSHHVFPYTVETLRHQPYLYGQLLFWYFAGKPYRVTKAVRIPLDPPGVQQRDSHVLRAVEDAQKQPIDIATRLQHIMNAAKPPAAESSKRPSGSGNSGPPAPVPNPEPLGHALFIGFGGAGDPAG